MSRPMRVDIASKTQDLGFLFLRSMKKYSVQGGFEKIFSNNDVSVSFTASEVILFLR